MREGRDAAHRQRLPGRDLGSGPGAATVPQALTGSVRARRLSVLLGGWMDPTGPILRWRGMEGGFWLCWGDVKPPARCPHPRLMSLPALQPQVGALGVLGAPHPAATPRRHRPALPPPGPSGSARSRWDPAASSSTRTRLRGEWGWGLREGAGCSPPPGTDLQRARPSRSCQEKWADYGMNAGQGRAGMQPP